jgi:hypothetical protein
VLEEFLCLAPRKSDLTAAFVCLAFKPGSTRGKLWAMTLPATSVILVMKWIFILLLNDPATVQAQSPTPACYSCPQTNNLGERLELELLGDTAISCVYLSVDCSYSNVSSAFMFSTSMHAHPVFASLKQEDGIIVSGTSDCREDAVNDCLIPRALARERALPKSPRPPSPGALAEKPKFMRTRAGLGQRKRTAHEM